MEMPTESLQTKQKTEREAKYVGSGIKQEKFSG